MKKITNFIAPLLKEYRYRNKPDPFSLFKKLRKNEVIPMSNKGNILILPIRIAPVSNLFEGVYGYAMRLRGYSVHALLCKQSVDKCDNIVEKSNSMLNCSLCNYEQTRFIDTFGMEAHTYSDILDENIIEKLRRISNRTSLNEIFSLTYDNILLGQHIKSAVMRYLMSSDVQIEKYENLIRKFTYTTLSSFESTKLLLNKLNPKFVLSSHGVYSTWGGALEACKLKNIPVIVWGRGYVGGDIIASYNQSYLYERVFEPVEYWVNNTMDNTQKKRLQEYFLQKRNPNSSVDHVNYYCGTQVSKEPLLSLLKLDDRRVKFGLFPNIPWDGTTFSASKAFPSIELFLSTTLQWFEKNSQFDLIIRAHPAELKTDTTETIKDVIDTIMPKLPSNIYFLEANHPVSSYEVEELCDCSLMYASTMALEFAYFGGTVIQAGQSNVSNKGFIFEADSVPSYENLLDKASKRELYMTDSMKEKVEKYAYHWIYKRHIPENTYTHKALTFTNYNIKSSMDLAPGKNKVVDFFIDRCEDGKPFIWESDA